MRSAVLLACAHVCASIECSLNGTELGTTLDSDKGGMMFYLEFRSQMHKIQSLALPVGVAATIAAIEASDPVQVCNKADAEINWIGTSLRFGQTQGMSPAWHSTPPNLDDIPPKILEKA